MDSFFSEVVFLGLILNLAAGIILGFFKKLWLRRLLIGLLCAGFAGIVIHHLLRERSLVVVPEVTHRFQDEAEELCKKQGLKPILKIGTWSTRYRAGEVTYQSLYAGSKAHEGREIELTISMGSPVGTSALTGDPCPPQ